MVGATCASCGAVNPIGAGSCVRCGRWLAPAGGPPAPPPPPPPPGYAPTYAPGYSSPWSGSPPGFTAANDGAALDRIQLASLVSFVAALVSPILIYGVGPFLEFSPLANAGRTSQFQGPAFDALIVAAVLGSLIGLVSLWLIRSGFAQLRPIDPRFSTPTSLIPLAFIGLALLAIGLPILLSSLGPVVQCAAHSGNQTVPTPTNCFATSGAELGVGALLSVIGGILALIGYIAMVLGLWRLGDRYGSTLLHVGAILTIFLPFIGWLLVFLGCREQRRRVGAAIGTPLG